MDRAPYLLIGQPARRRRVRERTLGLGTVQLTADQGADVEGCFVERVIPRPLGRCRDTGALFPQRRAAVGACPRRIKQEVGFKARRWVVERTHSWMNRFRRILTRWEKKLENYLGFLHLACALITYRAAGLLR